MFATRQLFHARSDQLNHPSVSSTFTYPSFRTLPFSTRRSFIYRYLQLKDPDAHKVGTNGTELCCRQKLTCPFLFSWPSPTTWVCQRFDCRLCLQAASCRPTPLSKNSVATIQLGQSGLPLIFRKIGAVIETLLWAVRLFPEISRSDQRSTRPPDNSLCPSRYPSRLLDENPQAMRSMKSRMLPLHPLGFLRDPPEGTDPGMEPMR